MERSVINGDVSSTREGIDVFTTLHLAGRKAEILDNPKSFGEHGGADPLMLKNLFSEDQLVDPLFRQADHCSAAWSVLIGIAINLSIESKQGQSITELVSGLKVPDDLKP